MINAERGIKFRAGKERLPKTKIHPEIFGLGVSGTRLRLSRVFPRVALLNTYDKKSRLFNGRDFDFILRRLL